MADQIQELVDTPSQFLKDGVQFMNKCQKPDQKEFTKICQAVGTGFVVMGVVGYVVKLSTYKQAPDVSSVMTNEISLVHIPINQILVGGA
ncbi:hypothetical protein E4U19_001757 [Claviceps sp. Clav32 group G5]|nr:hypothetical protein E4U19_001757 [Claviceps sp. Clav32 group G5]KAG6029488.1 hypothetical protein E4U40_000503 [Claviceps sp. LM458 group G5]KAG6049128.1 hypothetical protein E4U39_006551 [Claviceps sp. Clav50 group G5]KAG6059220.1 hypothetical protein E4U17_006713 [Claviceps sp. LM77 group G4]KAG6077031.1 hypothetical protein E4U33_001492 [Claviceps sp. LM78 group G4]KAG6083904.1 hypothetical protein E4U16_003083 [Claviceps sp. LM84 group G4]